MPNQSGRAHLEADRGRSAQRPSMAAKGAPPGNTAPGNSDNGGTVKILRSGIDSLYLSYPGSLFSESAIGLDTLKRLAQSANPKEVALAQYAAHGHTFEVRDKGSRHFAYVLADNWFRLNIASQQAQALPLAHVQITSEVLTLQGVWHVEKVLRDIVDTLGQRVALPQLSRVDICVDFVTDYPLHRIRDEDWITRAKTIDRYSVHRQFSGYTIGGGGALLARLYDKTLEIENSGKTFFRDIWKRYGWQDGQTVWRLEFQFRRSVLKELGVSTFEGLEDKLGGLWGYATRSWLRLADPDSPIKKRADRPDHPLWSALQKADWLDAEPCVRVPVEKGRLPSDDKLFVNGLSGITSFMAREGIFSPEAGLQGFWHQARAYHDTRANFTGLPFADYLIEKARAKARLYNTNDNRAEMDGPDPVTQDVAREYKRRRDG